MYAVTINRERHNQLAVFSPSVVPPPHTHTTARPRDATCNPPAPILLARRAPR